MNGKILRVVLDTNIVVSAVLTRNGLESRILRHVLRRELKLYTSLPILNEYAEVLGRPKFRLSETAREQIIEGLEIAGAMVTSKRRLFESPDPEDNMFLECADAARADYLITGNLRHFPSAWKETRIVSSRQFLTIFKP